MRDVYRYGYRTPAMPYTPWVVGESQVPPPTPENVSKTEQQEHRKTPQKCGVFLRFLDSLDACLQFGTMARTGPNRCESVHLCVKCGYR